MITYNAEDIKMPKIKRRETTAWIKAVAAAIITFDYDEGDTIHGDIVISLDTVRSNAECFGKRYEEELRRVIIHGILHLCGINDKGPGEREIMEAHENEALALWERLHASTGQ